MAKDKLRTVVVAKAEGYYNDTYRVRGARFGLRKPEDFSAKWMVDPNDPEQAAEAEQLLQEFRASHPARAADVSDDVIMAELAQSGGVVAALDQKAKKLQRENDALAKRIAELEALQNEPAEKPAATRKGPAAKSDGFVDGPDSESEGEGHEDGGAKEGPSEGTGGADKGAEAPAADGEQSRARPSRRRRA